MLLDIDEIFTVGQDTYFSSMSPGNSYGVTFEDDLATGYFYAVETNPDMQVLDALHIYNVDHVIDKDKPGKLQITWSDDGLIASLIINNYCHALFDFENKAGYCRNGFPDNGNDWSKIKDRTLTDELIEKIFAKRK
jgi:hypothetical protein